MIHVKGKPRRTLSTRDPVFSNLLLKFIDFEDAPPFDPIYRLFLYRL